MRLSGERLVKCPLFSGVWWMRGRGNSWSIVVGALLMHRDRFTEPETNSQEDIFNIIRGSSLVSICRSVLAHPSRYRDVYLYFRINRDDSHADMGLLSRRSRRWIAVPYLDRAVWTRELLQASSVDYWRHIVSSASTRIPEGDAKGFRGAQLELHLRREEDGS